MFAETVPWKMLSATTGLGVLTDGWNLAEPIGETDEPDSLPARQFTTEITFASAFAAPPVIHLGLTGFDMEGHESARITLKTEAITAEGFRVTVGTWWASRVYAVEFSWLAIGG